MSWSLSLATNKEQKKKAFKESLADTILALIINFPLNIIEKYRFFESNRWDLETKNKKIIKLPNTNYIRSLKNYLKIRNKDSF